MCFTYMRRDPPDRGGTGVSPVDGSLKTHLRVQEYALLLSMSAVVSGKQENNTTSHLK